jgi:aspartate carbamoyltransferase catalytic subunit
MSQQQDLLRDAMRRLNLTRDAFSERLGVRRRALDTWLLPSESSESRAMPEMVGKFVAEILQREALGAAAGSTSTDQRPLVQRIAAEGKPQLLSVAQFDRGSLEDLFQVADVMQPIARRQKVTRILEGAVLGSLFFEASTRTRVSFGAAFCRLGGTVCDTTGFTFSSMAKGESIYDTSRVMSGYVDALVVRHPEQGSVAEFARATNIPVINAGDGPGEHPSQAVLDLYTIQREFSRMGKLVDGTHIAMVGDLKYGRTVHSLIRLLSLYRNLKFTLIAPPSLEMPAYLVELVAQNGHVARVSGTQGTRRRSLQARHHPHAPVAARRARWRERLEHRPQSRPAAGDLPADRQRHSGAHGPFRSADGCGQAGGAVDARCRLALARAHRAGRRGFRRAGLNCLA